MTRRRKNKPSSPSEIAQRKAERMAMDSFIGSAA